MGIWQAIASAFKPKQNKKRAYAGAELGRLTNDWVASGTSADSEIKGSLARLRNRSRQLCRDNDYAKGALRQIVNNTIGQGIPFQSQVKRQRGGALDDATNSLIEDTWKAWGNKKYCDVAGKLSWNDIQRLAMRSLVESGEVIIRKVKLGFGGCKIPFALEIIESDQLDENYNRSGSGNEIRMGVELDKWGRPLAYYLKQTHPGDYMFGSAQASVSIERIPAEEIIHLYICDRPGQTRGVPWFYSSLKRMRDLGGYEEAEIVAARAHASIMGFIESPDGDLLGDGVQGNQRLRSLSPGTIELLAPGEHFNGFSPTRPSSGYDAFVRQMLRGMASGIGVSYESLSADYSQSNYSSSRLALLSDRDNYRVLQEWIIHNLHQPVLEAWMDMAVLSGMLPLKLYELDPYKYQCVTWQPRGWSWVDPQKEISATIASIGAGLTTLTDEIAKQGGDVETVFKTRKRELDLAASYGLKLYSPPTMPQVGDEADLMPALVAADPGAEE